VRGLEIALRLVRVSMRLWLPMVTFAALAGCAPLPPAPAPSTPPAAGRIGPPSPQPYVVNPATRAYARSANEVSSPAVLGLLDQARTELDSGHSDQSVATLERALRIEPRNPFLWQALADAHLRQNLPDQAETVAQRSNSLASGNPYLEMENWRLIASAREARGDTAGAQQAQARMVEVQERLNRQ
jgi:predicted Zn-dependent protease